jgi:hypothetical protein
LTAQAGKSFCVECWKTAPSAVRHECKSKVDAVRRHGWQELLRHSQARRKARENPELNLDAAAREGSRPTDAAREDSRPTTPKKPAVYDFPSPTRTAFGDRGD